MEFLPAQLIKKKRQAQAHTKEELDFLIRNYTNGALPDYQMAAWLMAAWLRGLSAQEAAWLTELMKNSGAVLDFSALKKPIIDKHSTGGIGDKTSLILAPLAAAGGLKVPMMAGRGLGHTGGTLDKLEAIPGFNVRLSLEQFQRQVSEFGAAIMGQTKEICPADLKLYSLRDVTATVDSIPLICASIMSKKLAEGLTGLVLDVKFGSGAFMKTLEDATALAQSLGDIGKLQGLKVHALLTNMNQPLGRYIGNALEVQECVDIMENKTYVADGIDLYADTRELTVKLAGHMFFLGEISASPKEGATLAENLLRSGAVYQKFMELVKLQGGTWPIKLTKTPIVHSISANRDGYVESIDGEQLGLAAIQLGAGRARAEDKIHYESGIEMLIKVGSRVKKDQPLCHLHSFTKENLSSAEKIISAAIKISSSPIKPLELIAKELTWN